MAKSRMSHFCIQATLESRRNWSTCPRQAGIGGYFCAMHWLSRRAPAKMSILAVILFACAPTALTQEGAPASRRVVMIVWDGMRPDMMTEKNCPTLWRLAQEGVTFRHHHSVYPTATNVNGTALVTGVYPARSGIIANHEYRPEIDNRKIIDVEDPAVVRKGDEISGGKYVALPTIAELVRASGRQTVVATAKTVGLLQDRHPFDSATLRSGQVLDSTREKNCAALFAGA